MARNENLLKLFMRIFGIGFLVHPLILYYFLFGSLSSQAIGTDCGPVSCAASGNIRQMYDLHTLDQEVKAIE